MANDKMTKTDLEKRFDPLFERMSKADISLNRPGFYKKLRQELKKERKKAYSKAIKRFRKFKDEPMTGRLVIFELRGLRGDFDDQN